MAERTRFEMTRRLFGANWLGPHATLEEICVGSWLEENGWKGKYQYLAPVGRFIGLLRTDFLLLGTAPAICIEVNGDRWHSGVDQQTADRRRAIALEQNGYLVVPVYGHDILGYRGHPVPTDASFNRIMTYAVMGKQLSRP